MQANIEVDVGPCSLEGPPVLFCHRASHQSRIIIELNANPELKASDITKKVTILEAMHYGIAAWERSN